VSRSGSVFEGTLEESKRDAGLAERGKVCWSDGQPSLISAMLSDGDVTLLQGRVNFYESCVEQLRDKVPKYLSYQAAVSTGSAALVKALRNVAASEPDRRIQNALFLFATKHDLLDKERRQYRDCEAQILSILEDARRMQIVPLKAILEESPQTRKNSLHRQSDPTLPLHSHFFETHRAKSMKKVIRRLLTTELKYHCRAIEELSAVLSVIDGIEA
jgi:hypothetical protein